MIWQNSTGAGVLTLAVLMVSGCADIAYRPDTEASYGYPSPSLMKADDGKAESYDMKKRVREARTGINYTDDGDGIGWVYTEYRDRSKSTTFKIAHIKGDNGALKVQCAVGGAADQSLDIFVHHPVLCGDGTVEGKIWEQYWQNNRPETHHREDELKNERVVQYDWNYKTLSNRGRATRGECQTYWIGQPQEPNSRTGDWLLALLQTRGTGYFRTVAHTEYDDKPIIMHHEKTGKSFEHAAWSHDFEYDYDIKIDLRKGKKQLARVLEACGY